MTPAKPQVSRHHKLVSEINSATLRFLLFLRNESLINNERHNQEFFSTLRNKILLLYDFFGVCVEKLPLYVPIHHYRL